MNQNDEETMKMAVEMFYDNKEKKQNDPEIQLSQIEDIY
jgi:hypothetical protein